LSLQFLLQGRALIRHWLLIVLDCARADHMTCYGYGPPTTPTIDALAAHGVLWEYAYSTSSWTKPAVSSMLTGLYPSGHGVFHGVKRDRSRPIASTDVLPPTCPTLAEWFALAGWRCAAFLNNVQLEEYTGLNRGFDLYVPVAGKADHLIAQYRDWLGRNLSSRTFAYLHFLETHWPYKPRRRHVAMFGGDRERNRFRDFTARDYARLRQAVSRGESSLTPQDWRDMIQMYDGALRRLDGKVKVILRTLEELELSEQSALAVTADHGEELGDHGSFGHGHTLYDEVLHVPFIMVLPDGPSGVRVGSPVSLVDLPATLLSAARIASAAPGVDLLSEKSPSPVCGELCKRHRYWQDFCSGRWKLHRRFRFDPECVQREAHGRPRDWFLNCPHRLAHELYERLLDPYEQTNLAEHPDFLETRCQLSTGLDRWWDTLAARPTPVEESHVPVDAVVVRRLRDLGYIE
jgi:arylsulfatase A-like enzyme